MVDVFHKVSRTKDVWSSVDIFVSRNEAGIVSIANTVSHNFKVWNCVDLTISTDVDVKITT